MVGGCSGVFGTLSSSILLIKRGNAVFVGAHFAGHDTCALWKDHDLTPSLGGFIRRLHHAGERLGMTAAIDWDHAGAPQIPAPDGDIEQFLFQHNGGIAEQQMQLERLPR
jgi:hypothetical protein